MSSFLACHEIILKAKIISRCRVIIPESQETSNWLKVSLLTLSFVRTSQFVVDYLPYFIPMILTDIACCHYAFLLEEYAIITLSKVTYNFTRLIVKVSVEMFFPTKRLNTKRETLIFLKLYVIHALI